MMTKEDLKKVADYIREQIVITDQMWSNNTPHAQIIGYLQGTLKGIAVVLDDSKTDSKDNVKQQE